MIEARRRDYLEALGIDVWLSRPEAAARDRLLIGAGQGSTLLICESPAATAGKLATDIARALGEEPVWAWPDPDVGDGSETLEEAIADRLFTRVIVFGKANGGLLFHGEVPAVLGSAAVNLVPGLDDLAVRGSGKQALWVQMKSWSETAQSTHRDDR